MPKFFVTSDVHSFYTELVDALNEAGFDANNENHYLVVCGDCFDRGPESQKVFDYLQRLPRKILIKGNHEQLLVDCCEREYAMSHDQHNGTINTILDLGDGETFAERCRTTLAKVAPFLNEMVNYFETENYIFVHSWVPSWTKDWRKASQKSWDDAVWGDPFEAIAHGLLPDKTIVFGHCSCSEAWAKAEGRTVYGDDARFDPYYGNGFVAIDGLTYYSGQKNVIVIEDEFI
jgi:serine/threonine protein phosphatase 1